MALLEAWKAWGIQRTAKKRWKREEQEGACSDFDESGEKIGIVM